MIQPGLVSITFRTLEPREIVALVARAGLRGIEWGGDIHVPHGFTARAREVRRLTLDQGLEVAAYGSYYRAGQSEDEDLPFASVLESAIELGAPTIRVWAGTRPSAQFDPASREKVITDLRRISELARAQGISISCEFHDNTLHDRAVSVVESIRHVDHPYLRTYWQPRHGLPTETVLEDLHLISPWLTHVHVFHWWPDGAHRLPLAEGRDRWEAYFAAIATLPGSRFAMLEFVTGDQPEAFLADAKTLKELLQPYRRVV